MGKAVVQGDGSKEKRAGSDARIPERDYNMIKKMILEMDHPTKEELESSLPNPMEHSKFGSFIKQMEETKRLLVGKDGALVWIAVDNPKLEKFFGNATRIR